LRLQLLATTDFAQQNIKKKEAKSIDNRETKMTDPLLFELSIVEPDGEELLLGETGFLE